ncbi:acyl-CoA N-acyltransferase [Umbelopsis sp. PMI_123]|nr:acyl-CoA N-acyltransferase [Umbelopsis sp. PMI_123]
MPAEIMTGQQVVVVREAKTSEVYDLHFNTAFRTFRPHLPLPDPIIGYPRDALKQDCCSPRCAFLVDKGDTEDVQKGVYVGGYNIFRKDFRIGTARVSAGCIGQVNSLEKYRKQKVGSALMLDAIDYAIKQEYAVLWLTGIRDFYHRWGYTVIYEPCEQKVSRKIIQEANLSTRFDIRQANVEDAERIVELYHAHFGEKANLNGFVRTVEWQRHRIETRLNENPYFLAVDRESSLVVGCMMFAHPTARIKAHELVGNTWDAMLALLQYQAGLYDSFGSEAPEHLLYQLPAESKEHYWMVENLRHIETSVLNNYSQGWMIRLVNLAVLIDQFEEEWRRRWSASLASWTGIMEIDVTNQTSFALSFTGSHLHVIKPGKTSNTSTTCLIKLSERRFIELVFGFKTLKPAEIEQQVDGAIVDEVMTVVSAVFPRGNLYVPQSDYF